MKILIATRGSKLALWQAGHVRDLLTRDDPDLDVELLVLKTTGDNVQDRPLQDIGGKGLFVKEIEEALLEGRASVAVHSMKDLPGQSPAGLVIAATPRREDARDALLCRPALRQAAREAAGSPLSALPQGATVGTTSLRRICQLRRLRSDLRFIPLRGNVDTRLRRLDASEMDAMVLATAGLARLGLGARVDAILPEEEVLPAVGQGALALQCRIDDPSMRARLARLSHEETWIAVSAERAFLSRLGGSCKTPLAAHATIGVSGAGDTLSLVGLVAHPAGSPFLRAALSGPATEAEALGRALAEQLLEQGAQELLPALGPEAE
jgi:hydroxymethylbilane synthase